MKILALETSTQRGDVSLIESGQLITNCCLGADEMSARMLVPTIKHLLWKANWSPQDLELVAVATGPGSFTGLRVGIMIAKTIAYAVGAEIVGVDTLRAIAAQAQIAPGTVWAILDAQRKQFFCQCFQCTDGVEPVAEEPRKLMDAERWLGQLAAGQRITGPGLKKFKNCLPDGVLVVDQSLWTPSAETVGNLATSAYLHGHRDDHWSLAPDYGRRSAAEEKLHRSNRGDVPHG